MTKVKLHIKMLLLLTGILLGGTAFAQYRGAEDLEKAKNFWNALSKDKTNASLIDSTKLYIDKSFADTDVQKNARANNLRGAIYKEVYRQREMGNYKSEARQVAVTSFLNSFDLDTTAANRDIVRGQLKWPAAQFNNDTKNALEKHKDFAAAEENFAWFKKLIVMTDPTFDIKAKEREFEFALGTAYEEKAAASGKKDFFDLAKVTYLKILDSDSLNGDANFKVGVMYYNQGANLIMKTMNYETPIDSIDIYEEMANKLFRQAEPFMIRAYKVKPNSTKILEGLTGIYYSLNDEELFKRYKALFDKLKENIANGLIQDQH